MVTRKLMVFTTVAFLTMAPLAFGETSPAAAGPSSSGPAFQGRMEQMSGPHWMGRFGRGDRMEYLAEKLGLTDDQKKKMRALKVSFNDRTRKARMSLISLKDEKRTMLMSGKVDQQKLAQMDEQIVKLVSELMTERLKMRRDRLALITPEQIDKLGEIVAKRGFHARGKGMHRGGGHFGGGGPF